ncbi:hypothetical protein AUF78_05380 [archaeon 13_1_20CM_2_51_12]|nr:MAG: hypothetical protein AUF78_05380 [archaeon 13_1_20CM_2_51_12]
MTDETEPIWDGVTGGILSIAIGLILVIYVNLSPFIWIISAVFGLLGVGRLSTVPEIRYYFKLIISWVSRKQVFRNTGSISGSNFVGNLDSGVGPVTLSQTIVQPKAPFLRATVSLAPGLSLGKVELQIDLKNIGDGIATDTEGELVLKGGSPVKVLDTSPLNVLPIGPGETGLGRISGVSDDILQGFASFSLSIRYKDVNGNTMKPIELKGTGDELRKKLNDDSWQRAMGQYGFE